MAKKLTAAHKRAIKEVEEMRKQVEADIAKIVEASEKLENENRILHNIIRDNLWTIEREAESLFKAIANNPDGIEFAAAILKFQKVIKELTK